MHHFFQGPIIGTFGASISTTGTSISIADRSAPMTAIIGSVSIDTCHVDYHDSSMKRSIGFYVKLFIEQNNCVLEPVGYVCDSQWTTLQFFQLVNLLFLQNGDSRTLPDVKPRVADELEKSKIWKLTEMNEPSQLRSLHLPDSLMPIRVCIAL